MIVNIKDILICGILVAALSAMSCSKESPSQDKETKDEAFNRWMSDGKLCILAIGNSFSVDAVEPFLYDLFDAAGIEATIGNMYIGGCSLETHWDNALNGNASYSYRKIDRNGRAVIEDFTLESALEDEDWDIITFQQVSGYSGIYSSYNPYLGNLIDWVTQFSDADLWFHQTWAYAQNSYHEDFPKYSKDQLTMYYSIMEADKQVLADFPIFRGIIPSGTAIQNGRTSHLGDSFNRDGFHLEMSYGQYTAACAWFETFAGKTAVGNSFAPESLDDKVVELCQTAAHLAVENPFEISDMSQF